MAILSTVVFAALCAGVARAANGVGRAILALQDSNSTLLNYPTQYTQGIVPKQIHSHNDYWREVPLLSAISYGVASVEADVWVINGTIYVAHEAAAVTPDRTFGSLYVNPLKKIIDGQNPKDAFTVNVTSLHGVFDTSSATSLYLYVDIKTDGVASLPAILEALSPLRDAGYLTTYHPDGSLNQSAVTVIGTGNSPLEQVKALSPRDYFFDAPLAQLTNTTLNPDGWNTTLSPVASGSYEVTVGWSGIGKISDGQLNNLTTLIDTAHKMGLQTRFWETPGWPVSAREKIWQVLLEQGSDWLNADDLKAASEF